VLVLGVVYPCGDYMNRITGGCKCGHVSFSANEPVLQVVTCHCEMCRRLTGAVSSTYVVVREEQFKIDGGREHLASYQLTVRTSRHFCSICGTPLFNSNPVTYKGLLMLYFGIVYGNEQLEPSINIFCESKLPWVTVQASSKSFPRTPA
jgi:hypothetical protein